MPWVGERQEVAFSVEEKWANGLTKGRSLLVCCEEALGPGAKTIFQKVKRAGAMEDTLAKIVSALGGMAGGRGGR